MGLGNPGPDYRETRHNAGFWFVERWAGAQGLSFRKPWFRPFLWSQQTVGSDRLILVKPLTYMNRSGDILDALFAKTGAGPSDLLVVFDQMDLPPGRMRLKPHGSAAGHNGLKSIDEALGTGSYHRLAVGVGRPAPDTGVIDHVLGVPPDSDRRAVEGALERAVSLAGQLWHRGWEPLMNAINQRDSS